MIKTVILLFNRVMGDIDERLGRELNLQGIGNPLGNQVTICLCPLACIVVVVHVVFTFFCSGNKADSAPKLVDMVLSNVYIVSIKREREREG